MSAFAVIYERDNAPANAGVLSRVLNQLRHRGPDGEHLFQDGPIALGHLRFHVTPEELEERQPLQLTGLPFTIVLDGRLDNRPELIAELKLDPTQATRLSDAALILHAYDRWGERCVERFIGEFAYVIHDRARHELVCARDALGERTLFYAEQGRRVVIASEPWALAAAFEPSPSLHEGALAHYYAFRATRDGQSLFTGIFELRPAHTLTIGETGLRQSRYWRPDLTRRLSGLTDEEYAREFLRLLEESVRCRLRASTPVGALMSGGLDSGSVASLAARQVAPNPFTAISYVFDAFPECDERPYINALAERWDLHSVQISCDDAWPYKDWASWPHNPSHPEKSQYRLIKERAYQQAKALGIRVLLTGDYGDHLYLSGMEWFADMLAEGEFRQSWRELAPYIRHAGWRWTWNQGFLQRAARRGLNAIPGGRHIHRPTPPLPWLTDRAADLLADSERETDPLFGRHSTLLAEYSPVETYHASRHEVELRNPYRDQRLIEFALSLPAYQLYHRFLYKRVLRNAMQGILPEIIRLRVQPTSLASFYSHGLKQGSDVLQLCFENQHAQWRRYVRADWLLPRWRRPVTPQNDGFAMVMPWFCASHEAWVSSASLN